MLRKIGWTIAIIIFFEVFIHMFSGLSSTGHHLSSTPPAVESSDDGCHADVVATDGTPPPGTPALDPQHLCDALKNAEDEAACMGDWQPPNPDRVNARELCLEVQQHGCGDPQRDCDEIPSDQTYYTHH